MKKLPQGRARGAAPFGRAAEFAVTLLLTFTTYLGFYFIQPMLATIARHFQIPPSRAGLLITVAIAPFAVGPLIYGRVLKRLSLRKLLALLVPAGGLALAACTFVPSFPLVLAFRLVQGITLPGILMCLTAHIALRDSGSQLQRSMALYATTTTFGAFLGRVVGSYVSARFGWQATFLALGGLQLFTCLPMALFIGDVRENGPAGADFGLADIRAILSDKKLCSVLFIAPLCVFCSASIVNVIPFYLRSVDPKISDFTIGLFYLGGFAGSFAGLASKQLIRLFRGEWNVVAAGIILLIGAIQAMLARHVSMALITMLGMSLGFALMNSTVPGILNRTTPFAKSLTNSVYLSFYYIFATVGTYLPLLAYTHFGFIAYDAIILAVFVLNMGIVYAARRLSPLAGR